MDDGPFGQDLRDIGHASAGAVSGESHGYRTSSILLWRPNPEDPPEILGHRTLRDHGKRCRTVSAFVRWFQAGESLWRTGYPRGRGKAALRQSAARYETIEIAIGTNRGSRHRGDGTTQNGAAFGTALADSVLKDLAGCLGYGAQVLLKGEGVNLVVLRRKFALTEARHQRE